LEIVGTECIWFPTNFCNWTPFFAGNCGELTGASPDLANFQERRKEAWAENGWSYNGKRERGEGRKGRGSASTPHEVPSNFSAVVAPV